MIFELPRNIAGNSPMQDERLYQQVVQELHEQGPKSGLWAKAFAESNGNDAQAKALYLRYRVAQLEEFERGVLHAGEIAAEARAREIYLRDEHERKERAAAEGLTPIHIILLGLPVLFLIILLVRYAHG
jgi:hypothetical protein